MKLKQHLIHLLGGLTIEESQDSDTNSFVIGQFSALQEAKTFAESLNGIPADDWCKTVYNHLCASIAETEHTRAAIAADPELTEAPVSEGSPRGSKPRNWPLPPMETAPKAPAQRWIPKSGETYHYIKLSAEMWCIKERVDEGSFLDYCAYDNNNCFKTAELAALALADIRDVLKFAKKE